MATVREETSEPLAAHEQSSSSREVPWGPGGGEDESNVRGKESKDEGPGGGQVESNVRGKETKDESNVRGKDEGEKTDVGEGNGGGDFTSRGEGIKTWLNLFLLAWVVLPVACMWFIILSPYIITYICAVVLALGFTSLWTGVWNVCTGPPITARRVQLEHGRNIAFEEHGPSAEQARHTIIVLHGILASRLSGFPRVSETLLWEYGVRVISFDRPGFGQSDYDPDCSLHSVVNDVMELVGALDVRDFWVMGLSGGGTYALAFMKEAPKPLKGVVLWAPLVNCFMPEICRPKLWVLLANMPIFATLRFAVLQCVAYIPDYISHHFLFARDFTAVIAPQFLWPAGVLSLLQDPLHFISRKVVQLLAPFVNEITIPLLIGLHTGIRDSACLASPYAAAILAADIREALRQGHYVAVFEDMLRPFRDWGFLLPDLEKFNLPVHVFHGTDDRDVPVILSCCLKRELEKIQLHLLPGEGHYSWFGCNSSSHRQLLNTIFGEPQGPLQNSNGRESSLSSF